MLTATVVSPIRGLRSPGCSVPDPGKPRGCVDGFEHCRFSIVADPRATHGTERRREREREKKNTRLANEESEESEPEREKKTGRKGNRERRQRENGKGDVYNLGPRWQLRGSRYAKKGLPHGIRISSRSHLNFNLGGAARTLFGAVLSPLGGPRVRGFICLPRTSSGKKWKGLRGVARQRGEVS